MPLIFYIIASLSVLGMAVQAFRWKTGRAALAELLGFEFLFLVCFVGALFPALVDILAEAVGMRLRAFFFFTMGIAGLTVFSYGLYTGLEKRRKELVRLAQTMALLDQRVRELEKKA